MRKIYVLFIIAVAVSCNLKHSNQSVVFHYNLLENNSEHMVFAGAHFDSLTIAIDPEGLRQMMKWKNSFGDWFLYADRDSIQVMRCNSSGCVFIRGNALMDLLWSLPIVDIGSETKSNECIIHNRLGQRLIDELSQQFCYVYSSEYKNLLPCFSNNYGIPLEFSLKDCDSSFVVLSMHHETLGSEQDFLFPTETFIPHDLVIATDSSYKCAISGKVKDLLSSKGIPFSHLAVFANQELNTIQSELGSLSQMIEYNLLKADTVVLMDCEGRYDIDLNLGSNYYLVFGGKSYVSKVIEIDLREFPEESGGYILEMDGTLFSATNLKGDFSFMRNPMAKANIEKSEGDLLFDFEYSKKMKSILDSTLRVTSI